MLQDAQFDARWDSHGEDSAILRVCGELDVVSAADLLGAIPATSDAPSSVVVDLAGLRFVDARGLSVLLKLRQDLQDRGTSVTFRGAHGIVRRVFHLTDLERLLDG